MKRKTLAKLTLLAAVAVPFSVRTPLLGQDRVQVEIANEVSSPGRILGFPLPFDEIPARFAGLSIQTVPDSDAKTALAFDEKALRKVLDVKVGRPHGAGIFNFAGEDILIARWFPAESESRLRWIGVWDAPRFTAFILDCDPQLFATVTSTQEFLTTVIRWKGLPSDMLVRVWWQQQSGNLNGHGTTLVASLMVGREHRIVGRRLDAAKYLLVILCGKYLFDGLYPDELAYISERFPPLRLRLPSLTKNRLLQMLSRTGTLGTQYEILDNQDPIIIAELLKRGLTEAEYSSILVPANMNTHLATRRIDRVVSATIGASQLEKYARAIEQSLLQLSANPGDRRPSKAVNPVTNILGLLRGRPELDLTDIACRFLSVPQYMDASLRYLMDRGHTEASYACVQDAVVTEDLRGLKENTMQEIKTRVHN